MTDLILRLTDAQLASLLSLAGDLRRMIAKVDSVMELERKGRDIRRRKPRTFPADDPWIDVFKEELSGDMVTSEHLIDHVIGLTRKRGRVSPADAARIGAAMRQAGWQGPKPLRVEGRMIRGYTRNLTQARITP
jgi:hypothetical protein